MDKIIECVPNFSEGRDPVKIKQIADAIKSIGGVKLLDVDPGNAANRTVITFAGEPEAVAEAAFQGIKKASEIIDMRTHLGEHPRSGATDVCPLVPIRNVTMEEAVTYARKLAERVGNELKIPVYCYEYAAFHEERRNLANCRFGKYEAVETRISSQKWKPDFGPSVWSEWVAKTGTTAIGARNFLIAYNINLNTTSSELANEIAFDVREAGRLKREGNPLTGKIITDETGKAVRAPGTLKKVKAIGWFIKEYGIAQVSMNLTDFPITPLHKAFEEVKRQAQARRLQVTGSEIVGLVPLQAMLDSGKYFLAKQQRSTDVTDEEIIETAIQSLRLDELKPFDPQKKIIEFVLER